MPTIGNKWIKVGVETLTLKAHNPLNCELEDELELFGIYTMLHLVKNVQDMKDMKD